MRNIITDLQNSGAWKIQLAIEKDIIVISSKDVEEEHVMHSSSSNIKFTPYSNANDVIDKLFKSFRYRNQGNLET